MKLATLKFIGTFNYIWQLKILVLSWGDFSIKGRNIFSGCGMRGCLALTLPWPCFDLSLTLLWPCLDLALMVKIGSVTAEILLIWTSLVRTFVASTKQLASVKDGPRILSLNFSQNQVSNSWDISATEKCHKNKCYLDKYHRNCWNLF